MMNVYLVWRVYRPFTIFAIVEGVTPEMVLTGLLKVKLKIKRKQVIKCCNSY